jgi:murein DD-endopeptidase MepM/ murein hydrolase activator NlpD
MKITLFILFFKLLPVGLIAPANLPLNNKQENKLVKSEKPAVYPKGYFRNPLAIPIQLAANFGELRTNHFHMGLDIRTNQRENLPVYASAEGYISKIKIEKSGFGRAIYINHPNGYTTVYAHLNDFFPALNEYVIAKQYKDEKWEQDFELPAGQFPVSKGQFIAYSGNTGGSQGPHLHFEIRDTETGSNYNPWLFGLGLPDYIQPYIYRLYYYDRKV